MYKVEVWIEDELSYSTFINARSEEEAEDKAKQQISIEFYVSEEDAE